MINDIIIQLLMKLAYSFEDHWSLYKAQMNYLANNQSVNFASCLYSKYSKSKMYWLFLASFILQGNLVTVFVIFCANIF